MSCFDFAVILYFFGAFDLLVFWYSFNIFSLEQFGHLLRTWQRRGGARPHESQSTVRSFGQPRQPLGHEQLGLHVGQTGRSGGGVERLQQFQKGRAAVSLRGANRRGVAGGGGRRGRRRRRFSGRNNVDDGFFTFLWRCRFQFVFVLPFPLCPFICPWYICPWYICPWYICPWYILVSCGHHDRDGTAPPPNGTSTNQRRRLFQSGHVVRSGVWRGTGFASGLRVLPSSGRQSRPPPPQSRVPNGLHVVQRDAQRGNVEDGNQPRQNSTVGDGVALLQKR